jgi:preprotein translocase subunit SecA
LINTLLGKVFGTRNEREVKRLMPRVAAINALEPEIQKLSDEQLRAKTDEFRKRIQDRLSHIADEPDADSDRLKQIETERLQAIKDVLDEILEEAFAVVREGGRRVLNMRHFDVQLIGGMVLHKGTISEMKTGEGKTLVATLPAYLTALTGRGVHVVTVNDYLAKRDSEWMGQLYRFLGLSVGVIVHDLDDQQRRDAYAADVLTDVNRQSNQDFRPVTEVEFGVDYALCGGCWEWYVQAAFVAQLWQGAGNSANSDPLQLNGRILDASSDKNADLLLYGLRLEMGLRF